MTILGNFLLLFASLIYAAILSTVYGKEPSSSGDSAGGYTWAVIITHVALLVVLVLATLIVASNNGFDWVSPDKTIRFWLVAGILLAAVVTSGLSALFKYEPGPVPILFRLFSFFVPALVPLAMIFSGFIFINPEWRASLPPYVPQFPLVVVAVIGFMGAGSGLWSLMAYNRARAEAAIEENQAFEKRNHQSHLDDIDNCDVSKNMVFILVFTDANHDADVRERALAKIKSRADWQTELLRLVGCDWAPQAFTFLASNDVDDKALFAEPVREGVLIQARLFRETIRRSTHEAHFYPDQFVWEVERVLRTVYRFQGMGVDYKPAVQELRAALDEPSDVKKVELRCKSVLDQWLKTH